MTVLSEMEELSNTDTHQKSKPCYSLTSLFLIPLYEWLSDYLETWNKRTPASKYYMQHHFWLELQEFRILLSYNIYTNSSFAELRRTLNKRRT